MLGSGRRIAVVGLGYVGLPVALAFGRELSNVVGFDIDPERVKALRAGRDDSGEVSASELEGCSVAFTSNPGDLAQSDLFVVAVPTPIDATNRPDLGPLRAATETVGRALRPGAVVVYESTVYPGVTSRICGPLLARTSGLRHGSDFTLGYSPERINPGDREHTLARVVKVVAAEDEATLSLLADVYGAIVPAGIHRASSIEVAEAAKVIENTQRDLNIALMNEFALIFDRLGIRTKDVLDAAATKWNFLRFHPGLVGGHCIGVDPYYLTTRAEEVGYHPQVILAGRRINDQMGAYVAQRLVKLLASNQTRVAGARVGILGLTFKEDVKDLRNSRVPDIVTELQEFGISPIVYDPLADSDSARRLYGIELCAWERLSDLDALILAVPHGSLLAKPPAELVAPLRQGGILMDVKSALKPDVLPAHAIYWSL